MGKHHQLLTGSIHGGLDICAISWVLNTCALISIKLYSVSFILEPLGRKSLGQNIAKVMSSLLGYAMPLRSLEK